MSYLDIHTLFMVLPIAAFWRHWRLEREALSERLGLAGVLVLAALATIWTMPWDNLMVLRGVWSYPADAVLGQILYIPIEEQLFFIIQPLFTGLWLLMLYPNGLPEVPEQALRPNLRIFSTLFILALGVGAFLLSAHAGMLYLGSFIAWFSIPLAIQWGYGADRLLFWRTPMLLGIIPPTIYLCLLDGIALRHQVWSISETHTTGLMVGPLPIEEVLFFLITNILVIQGLALFIDRVQHHRRRSAHHVAPV